MKMKTTRSTETEARAFDWPELDARREDGARPQRPASPGQLLSVLHANGGPVIRPRQPNEKAPLEPSPPTNAVPASGAGREVIAASGLQHVLSALANVGGEPEQLSTLARVQRTRTDYAMVLRRPHKHGRTTQAETAGPEEQDTLDGLACASADLKAAVRRMRAQFLRLADNEIRKTLEMELGDAHVGEESPRAWDPPADSPHATAPQGPMEVIRTAPAPAMGEQGRSSDELYEGTVRLLVMADGNVQRIVEFVDELCRMPQFRMLRMMGSHQQEGAEISLGLREPLPFRRILASMRNVASVDGSGADLAEQVRGVAVYLTPTDAEHELVVPAPTNSGATEG